MPYTGLLSRDGGALVDDQGLELWHSPVQVRHGYIQPPEHSAASQMYNILSQMLEFLLKIIMKL